MTDRRRIALAERVMMRPSVPLVALCLVMLAYALGCDAEPFDRRAFVGTWRVERPTAWMTDDVNVELLRGSAPKIVLRADGSASFIDFPLDIVRGSPRLVAGSGTWALRTRPEGQHVSLSMSEANAVVAIPVHRRGSLAVLVWYLGDPDLLERVEFEKVSSATEIGKRPVNPTLDRLQPNEATEEEWTLIDDILGQLDWTAIAVSAEDRRHD